MRKLFEAFLTFVLVLILCLQLFGQVTAPDKVKVGDLAEVTIDSPSVNYAWIVEGVDEANYRIIGGSQALIAAKSPGEIVVTVAGACEGGEVCLHKVVILVERDLPPVPPGFDQEFTQAVAEVAYEGKAAHQQAIKSAFSSAATLVTIGTITEAQELVEYTHTSISDALGDNKHHWRRPLKLAEQELNKLAEQGDLPDIEAHARQWRRVANLL